MIFSIFTTNSNIPVTNFSIIQAILIMAKILFK
jgi:hypothetical protein